MNANITNPPAPFAVVVPDLNPEYGLLVMKPADDLRPGEVLPIYASYTSAFDGNLSYTVPGKTPKDWLQAVEEDYQGTQIIFKPIPDLAREISPSEYPKGTFQIAVTNCKIIPMPQPEGRQVQFKPPTDTPFKPVGECRVIEHQATTQLRRGKQYPAEQLAFPFAQTDKIQSA